MVEKTGSSAKHRLQRHISVGRFNGKFDDDSDDADDGGNAKGVQHVEQELLFLSANAVVLYDLPDVEAAKDIVSYDVHPEEGVEKTKLTKN